jgi:pimeloyl-ACP methyl ester carboxylesterase
VTSESFFSFSPLPRWAKWLLRLTVLTLICGYGAYIFFIVSLKDFLIFRPDKAPLDITKTSLSNFEQIQTITADGEHILLWVSPPKGDKPVLLFFPGNGGTIQGLEERFATLTKDGIGLVALSYRGYGGSTGVPSEKGVKLDGEAAYDLAVQRFGEKRKIVAYGESFGTGIAVYLATQKPLAAVILQAPYSSLQAVAKIIYPFPVAFFVRSYFPSDQIISQIHAPLLILHGEKDGTIPVEQAQTLYDLALPPKQLVIFTQGTHGLVGTSHEILKFLHSLAQNSLPSEAERHIDAP